MRCVWQIIPMDDEIDTGDRGFSQQDSRLCESSDLRDSRGSRHVIRIGKADHMTRQGDGQSAFVEKRKTPDRRRSARRPHDKWRNAIQVFGEWMADQQQKPFFLVDRSLMPVFYNRAAESLLRRDAWIRINERRLEIVDPVFQQALRGALEERPTPRQARTRLHMGTHTLEVAFMHLRSSSPRLYLIALDGPDNRGLDVAKLKRAFRFTPAEAEVAAAICRGGNRLSIAQDRGVALSTVKTQLGEVFRKVGVRTQRGLVQRIGEWAGKGARAFSL